MGIKSRIQRLEQTTSGGTIYKVIDGFKYIGGKHGFLKIPLPCTEVEWLVKYSPDYRIESPSVTTF